MLDFLKLFNRKPTKIELNSINKISEPYSNEKVFYCGFDYIIGGSVFSSGKNIFDQAIIVFRENNIKILSTDGKVVEFSYGGFSTYVKSQEIIFSVNEDDIVTCWSFLTVAQLNLIPEPDSKNILVREDDIDNNIKQIESIMLQRGGEKVQVEE